MFLFLSFPFILMRMLRFAAANGSRLANLSFDIAELVQGAQPDEFRVPTRWLLLSAGLSGFRCRARTDHGSSVRIRQFDGIENGMAPHLRGQGRCWRRAGIEGAV